ncbi:hypothetical protein [Staphylococcus aureus]|uniref:hypothetical protein n=1 Tax=Staphylococcus aureus TaxID=1280 RepID=UPI001C12B485|nr:hypothetical protein [Staphylococcus aureus]
MFFTIILGAFVFGERLQGKQLAGIALAIFGVLVLVEGSLGGEHVPLVGFMLTLAAALSWACGNIFNKKIMSQTSRPPIMSLVVWRTHPERVTELVLRGIFTMREQELDWYYNFGASEVFPELWNKFCEPLRRVGHDFSRDNIAAYYDLLWDDDPDVHGPAAVAWTTWELWQCVCAPMPELSLTPATSRWTSFR